jgi:hypothetical protein
MSHLTHPSISRSRGGSRCTRPSLALAFALSVFAACATEPVPEPASIEPAPAPPPATAPPSTLQPPAFPPGAAPVTRE